MTGMNHRRILITGGAGYIGSHTLIKLLKQQYDVCVYDNYSNSSPLALDRVRKITNLDFEQVEGDIRDEEKLRKTMAQFRPEAVLHFAGLKAVGDSEKIPLDYYEHNVFGSLALLKAMNFSNCHKLVFSSSATVYGQAKYLPYDEKHPLAPTNTYGRTKLFVENIINDWTKATIGSSAVLLRYFNPLGAHPSGMIGEDPNDKPNNLMPFMTQVAVGKRPKLSIFGNDYDTRDGTGERDYIHVEDLADAHLAAEKLTQKQSGCEAINVGTGTGVTVLELINAFQLETGQSVAYEIVKRRNGDVACSVADASKAKTLMGWSAQLEITDMCRSAWNWQFKNPNGYAKK